MKDLLITAHARERLKERYNLEWTLEEWQHKLADVLEEILAIEVRRKIVLNDGVVIAVKKTKTTYIITTVIWPEKFF